MQPHMNGSEFELGRIIGQLITLTERQIEVQDKSHETLLDMRGMLATMPHVIGEKIAHSFPPSSASRIKDITELIRALGPLIIFVLAVFTKGTWPQALPVLREVLAALIR